MRRAFLAITWLVFAVAATSAGCQAVVFTEGMGADLPGSDGGTPALVAGPYLQNMATSTVTILWQTDSPSTGQLKVSDGDTETSYQVTTPRRLSEVRVSRLIPDTLYTYTVSLGGRIVGEGRFKTFPMVMRPVKFIVYGDSRSYPKRHEEVVDAMARESGVDFVLHTGDVVGSGKDLASWIPMFFTPARKMIGNVPFFFELGNHEGDSRYYYEYFGSSDKYGWYSFDVADVHVIGLDSNKSFDIGSEQYKWLINDLTAHKGAPWKFIFMHHPTYSSGPHGGINAEGLPKEKPVRDAQELLPKLAEQFHIAAIFAGHDHAYERSVRDGVHYIVSGGGGAESYGEPNVEHNPYTKVFQSTLHYCVISIDGNRASMVVKTPAGKVIDKVDF